MVEILDFFAVWCNPCKAYSNIINKVKENCPEVEVTKIDIESDEGDILVNEYGVRNVPYTVIKRDGKVIFKKAGVLNFTELVKMVRS